ncbi:alkaline phosphatase family protein [Niabella terrae]
MKRFHAFFLFLFIGFSTAFSQPIQRPKLVIGIVADQMRWDYLYRYYDRYGEDGFKRLLGEGFSCENNFINYIPSYTAIGHTSVFTGSVPAIHGIAGNNWIDQATGKNTYCTEDSTVSPVGTTSNAGKMSPRNLLATTITDELRLATNFRSKVIGVSLKDRASILPAGHHPTGAFWYDGETGNFITSSWYMKELPQWLQGFNAKKEAASLLSKPWTPLYPIETYKQSTQDDTRWEGKFKGESKSSFPHDLAQLYKSNKDIIKSTPFGNTLTLNLAKAAVEGNQLGGGAFTDFLTINLASTDYVGHMYGPNSIEIEDVYLRLDRDLGNFLKYMDQKLGKGNYLVFLTADHGAAHAINFMAEYQMPSGFLGLKKIVSGLNKELASKYGQEKLVISNMNYQIHFNKQVIKEKSLDYDAIKKTALQYLRAEPDLQFVIDIENIGAEPVPEPIKTKTINGYNSKRSGTIQVIPYPGWFEGSPGGTGTTHGTWNPHDTHIPLVWFGWGIKQGKTNRTTHITDISATLAALLHIQMPSGCIGDPITEITQ